MIVVLSQGCAANFGDGEKIARILSQKSEVTFEFPEAKPAHSTRAASFSSKTPANLENAENSTSAENPANFSTEKPEAFYLNVCTVKGNAGAIAFYEEYGFRVVGETEGVSSRLLVMEKEL